MNLEYYTRQKAFKALGDCTQERLIRELTSDNPQVVKDAKANFAQLKALGVTGRGKVTVVKQRSELRHLDRKTLRPRPGPQIHDFPAVRAANPGRGKAKHGRKGGKDKGKMHRHGARDKAKANS